MPGGHPEAFFEAFANIYRAAYDNMVAAGRPARSSKPTDTIYPNVNDGVEGMYFIQQSVASSAENGSLAAAEAPARQEVKKRMKDE